MREVLHTSSLLRDCKNLVPRFPISNYEALPVPFLYPYTGNHKLGHIFRAGEYHGGISRPREASKFVLDIQPYQHRRKVGLEFWHAKIVHEESVAEEGIFEIRFIELGDGSELICHNGELFCMSVEMLVLRIRGLVQ